MKVEGRYVALTLLLILFVSVAIRGQSTQPASRWGFDPYNKLTSLTPEQKLKIGEIHHKALAEKKAIDDKEEADILALLTPDQKAELEKIAADKKAKAAERRHATKDAKAGKKDDDSADKN